MKGSTKVIELGGLFVWALSVMRAAELTTSSEGVQVGKETPVRPSSMSLLKMTLCGCSAER